MSITKNCDTCKFDHCSSIDEPCNTCSNSDNPTMWQPKPIDSELPVVSCATETKQLETITGRVTAHAGICRNLTDMYERKNHDYGDSFHQTFLDEGYAMVRIRLSDKLNRIKTLTKGTEQMVDDETLEDTLMDLANYSIMALIETWRAKK